MSSGQAAEILKAIAPISHVHNVSYKLAVLEAIGTMVLMLHHMRGCLDWFVQSGAIAFRDEERKAWEQMKTQLSELEIVVCEIAPARALLPELRELRLTGNVPDTWEVLLPKDYRGRIPENRQVPVNTEQIRALLNRLGDVEEFLASDMKEPIRD